MSRPTNCAVSQVFFRLIALALLCPSVADAEERGERLQQKPPDIPVMLHVVACASDLLLCQDVEAPRAVFWEMANCQAELPAAKGEAERLARRAGEVVFARCRYSPAAARIGKREPLNAGDWLMADQRLAKFLGKLLGRE